MDEIAPAVSAVRGSFLPKRGRKHGSSLAAAASFFAAWLLSVLLSSPAIASERGIDLQPTSIPASGRPFAIIATDLNRDGHQDLAVSHFTEAKISILIGRGDGTFEEASQFPTGKQPRGLTAADFNEDGHLDLAAACKGQNSVFVHFGAGDGSFSRRLSIRVPVHPFMLEAADLEADGHMDLIVASEGETENGTALSVLRGDGSGRLTMESFQSGRYGSDIAIADYNRDGSLDVAITTWGSNDVNVHLGRGDGTFAPPKSFTYTGHGLYRVLATDLNRDENPDMIWNDLERSALYVLYGDGKGDFPKTQLLPADQGIRHAVAADLNGDQWPDLISANTRAGNISVILSEGEGDFLPAQSFPAGNFPRTVAAADFDEDGRIDVAATGLQSSEIIVFLNRGAAALQPETLLAASASQPAADESSFLYPNGIWLDPSAKFLLVADQQHNRIARVEIATGTVTTVAGDGKPGDGGDGGLATAAQLKLPSDAVMDTHGNLYIADFGNHRVRRVDPNGIITTFAGTGEAGYSGDAGQATDAKLSAPFALALDRTGRLFVADLGNHRIRVIGTDGRIETFAGTGVRGGSGDGGPASDATFGAITDLTFDEAGNLFVVDQFNYRIRKIAPDGNVTTVAGTGRPGLEGDGGPAVAAELHHPSGVATASGDFYIADQDGNRIRKVTTKGIIETMAGQPDKRGYGGDGGPASKALIWFPSHIVADDGGSLYFTDRFNHCVRKIDSSGIISTVAGKPVAENTPHVPTQADSGELDVSALLPPPQLDWEYELRSGSDANAVRGVAVDEDGRIYVAGDVGSGADWRVARIGRNGKVDWTFDIEEKTVQIPRALTLSADGQVVSAGTVYEKRDHPFVLSLTREGKENWRYAPQGDQRRSVHDVASDRDSQLYLAGEVDETWEVTKLDSKGGEQWKYRDKRGSARAVDVDANGNVLVAGFEPALWRVIKLDAQGDLLWEHRVEAPRPGPNVAVAYDLQVDSAGNTVVTGVWTDDSRRLRVEKLDAGGKLLWEYLDAGGEGMSAGHAVALDSAGNSVVVGYAGNDWLMLALDSDGKLLWRSTHDGGGKKENKDEALAVAVTGDGKIVVVGIDHPVPAKFPSLGAVEWRVAQYSVPAREATRD